MPPSPLHTSFFTSRKALWVAILVFLSGMLIFAICNRISIDDMFFYARCRDNGVSAMVSEQYNTYSGRFSAYYMNGFTLFYFNQVGLVLWNMISITCFFLSVRYLIKSCPYIPSTSGPGWIFLFSALIFGCSHPGEQFFWYTQVNTYLWSATCAAFLLAVLAQVKINLGSVLLIPPAIVFMGGSSESFLLQLLFLLGLMFIMLWGKQSRIQRALVVQVILLLALVGYFNVFAPGNVARGELLRELNQTGFIKALAQSVYAYFSSETAIISYAWIIPSMAGVAFYLKPPVKSISVLWSTLIYVLFLVIFLAPSAWALREPAPARALITCDVLTTAYMMIILQKLTLLARKKPHPSIPYGIGLVTLTTAIIIYSSQCITYSQAYDKRGKLLNSISTSQNSDVKLEPLPGCRMLKSASTSTNPQHFSNQHLRAYYGISGTVHE